MRFLRFGLLAVVLSMFWLVAANAALVSRLGGQAYYDEEQDITWIADFNLAAINSFGLSYDTNLGDHPDDSYGYVYTEQIVTGGSLNWGAALWWIDAMNASNYLGANTWRLPTAPANDPTCDPGPDYGVDCTGSEMGYLYYVHGITSATPSGFSNVEGTDFNRYWTGTEYAYSNTAAHIFIFSSGYSDVYNKYVTSDGNYAVAVLDGDIAAVPIPPSIMLFGTALSLLGWVRRRTEY